jgi:hypothetical protein
MSNQMFGKIAKLKTPYDMWIYLRASYQSDSTLSYVFALRSLSASNNESVRAKVSLSEFISPCETDWNRSSYRSQSSAAVFSIYRKIVTYLFACQEAKKDFLLCWFAESQDNDVENLSSQDHLSYYEAKMHIWNLLSNHRSHSGAFSKNSKPQYKAYASCSLHRKKDKKTKNRSSSSSNSGSKECNCYRKHLPGTVSSHI